MKRKPAKHVGARRVAPEQSQKIEGATRRAATANKSVPKMPDLSRVKLQGRIDATALIGRWPFRPLPYGDAASLRAALERSGITHAIAGSLDAVLYRNPQDGNEELYRAIEKHHDFYSPAVTLDPSYPAWEKDLQAGLRAGCVAARTYPEYQGWNFGDSNANELAKACVEHKLPLILVTEIEDVRQRHNIDKPRDWIGGELRGLVERVEHLHVIVANARADRIRELGLALAAQARERVFYDTSAVWGPFVDDLKSCIEQIGLRQFVFGTHSALKTPESAVTRVRLTDISEADKRAIYAENVRRAVPRLGNKEFK